MTSSRQTSLAVVSKDATQVMTPAEQSRATSRGEQVTRDPSRAASMEPLLELPSDNSAMSKEETHAKDVTTLESIADVTEQRSPSMTQDPSRLSSIAQSPSRAASQALSAAPRPGTQPAATPLQAVDLSRVASGTAGHSAQRTPILAEDGTPAPDMTRIQSQLTTVDVTSRDPTMIAAQTPNMVSHDVTAISGLLQEPTDVTAAAAVSQEPTLVASRVVSRRESLAVPEVNLEGEPQVARKLSVGSEAANEMLDTLETAKQSAEPPVDTLEEPSDVTNVPQTPALEITPGEICDNDLQIL